GVPVAASGRAGAKLSPGAGTGLDGAAVVLDLGVRQMNGFPLLTALTLVPLLGGLIVVGLDARRKDLARGLALTSSLAALGLAILVWKNFDPASAELQFAERHDWIPSLGIQYFVGVDGLGLLMVLLTALVVPMALLA